MYCMYIGENILFLFIYFHHVQFLILLTLLSFFTWVMQNMIAFKELHNWACGKLIS